MAGAVQDELELHSEAYLQIFQAVLKKLPLDDAARGDRLRKLKAYLDANVHSADEFINHLPDFARGLGVKEAALSKFVGSNFMKALTLVKQKHQAAQAQAAAGGSAAAGSAPQGGAAGGEAYATLIAEILGTVGTLVQPPDRFELFEAGLLKFVSQDGDVLPQSHAPSAPAETETPEATGAAPTSGAAVPAAAAADQAPAPKKAAPAPVVEDKPIIAEILERFGNHLDIPGKLEPSTGLEKSAQPAADSSGDAPAADGDEGVPGTAPETAAAPVQSAKTKAAPPEKPFIAEILESFGSVLSVHEKLVPTTGLESSPGEPTPGAAAVAPAESAPELEPVPEVAIEPIPLDFNAYIGILQKLQQFQQSGDQDAYRQWLTGPAGIAGKAIVGLRNFEAKNRAQGGQLDSQAEYYTLAHHLPGVSTEQVEELHRRTGVYARIQAVVSRLKQSLKTKSPGFKQAIKTIWPSAVLLFNENASAAEYMSQFKITLLQVADPALKQELEAFMEPQFAELASLYQEIAQA